MQTFPALGWPGEKSKQHVSFLPHFFSQCSGLFFFAATTKPDTQIAQRMKEKRNKIHCEAYENPFARSRGNTCAIFLSVLYFSSNPDFCLFCNKKKRRKVIFIKSKIQWVAFWSGETAGVMSISCFLYTRLQYETQKSTINHLGVK